MKRRYMYLLKKIKDGTTYKKGEKVWADSPCKGWHVIRKIEVSE